MSTVPTLNLSRYGVQPADLNGSYTHIGDLHIIKLNNSVHSSNGKSNYNLLPFLMKHYHGVFACKIR